MNDFNAWMEQKYIDWRGKSRRSISDFANEIGIPQPIMSGWMRVGGKVPKTKKYIDILIARFGDEVYDILGIPKVDTADILAQAFPNMSPIIRDQLAAALSELEETTAGLSPDDAQTTVALINALKNNGFRIG